MYRCWFKLVSNYEIKRLRGGKSVLEFINNLWKKEDDKPRLVHN